MAEVRVCAYGQVASAALQEVVAAAQAADRLAPVTVVVPSQLAGLAQRRALAAAGGIANVTFLTPLALAERLGGSRTAAADLVPLTDAVLVAAIRVELRAEPGMFAPVAEHAATESALARRYLELVRCRPETLTRLRAEGSTRARALVDLVERVRARLAGHLDESRLVAAARDAVTEGDPAVASLGTVVVFLPQADAPGFVDLVVAVAGARPTTWIVGATGDGSADASVRAAWRAAGAPAGIDATADASVVAGTEMISTSDVDEEVRAVVRRLLALAADGIGFDRMAVLYPSLEPYARTVHAQLEAAGIAHNAPAIRRLADTVAGRAVSRLVAMVDAAFARDEVIEFLASVPQRRADGGAVPVDAWDRVSRRAGVVRGDDWTDRLGKYATEMEARAADRSRAGVSDAEPRWAAATARACGEFVGGLREQVAAVAAAGGWAERASRVGAWLDDAVGPSLRGHAVPETEQDALDAVHGALERLAALDAVEPTPAPGAFARALTAELDAPGRRVGRVGIGVACGPVAAGIGSDVDVVCVLGLTEGSLPVTRREDALLGDTDRALAVGHELPTRDDALARQRHQYLAALGAGGRHRILSAPRGDLRTGRERLPSRWLLETASLLAGTRVFGSELAALSADQGLTTVPSYSAALADVDGAALATERVLGLVVAAEGDAPDVRASDHPLLAGTVTALGIDAQLARAGDAFTRWDGNVAAAAHRVGSPATGGEVSPTRLQDWVECPMRYLLAHVLRVPAEETPERLLELSPLDRGTLVHEVLERFIGEELARPEAERVPAGATWGPEHLVRMRELVAECADAAEAAGLTGKATLWALHREEIEQELGTFLEVDNEWRRYDDAVPESVELPFGLDGRDPVVVELDDGRAVRFRGRADRVDVRPDGTRIVLDYKTGRKPDYKPASRDDPVRGGRRLQLPVYAEAARQLLGAEHVEAAYWYVSDRGRWERDPFVLDAEGEARFREVVGHVVDGIDAGVFPATPGEASWFYGTGQACGYCDYDALCPVDRIDQSERKWQAVELGPLHALTWAPAGEDEA